MLPRDASALFSPPARLEGDKDGGLRTGEELGGGLGTRGREKRGEKQKEMREEGKEKRILFIGGSGIISFDSKKFLREREGEREIEGGGKRRERMRKKRLEREGKEQTIKEMIEKF